MELLVSAHRRGEHPVTDARWGSLVRSLSRRGRHSRRLESAGAQAGQDHPGCGCGAHHHHRAAGGAGERRPRWRGEDANRYLGDVIEVCEAHRWSWAYHAWREWEGWDAERGNLDRSDTARKPNTPRMGLLKSFFARN